MNEQMDDWNMNERMNEIWINEWLKYEKMYDEIWMNKWMKYERTDYIFVMENKKNLFKI